MDPGKEFFGNVTTLINKHTVDFQRSEAGNYRAQAFVERANRTLGEKRFLLINTHRKWLTPKKVRVDQENGLRDYQQFSR